MILRSNKDIDIQIGKLGSLHFKKGLYVYIGSAQGNGGFKRVTRHFDVASGRNHTRKWHIDYLLPYSRIECAVLLPGNKPLECMVATTLKEFLKPIPGFGCSDCSCETHLLYTEDDSRNEIIEACSKLTENESIIISPRI